MKIETEIAEQTHAVEIDEAEGRFRLAVDGRVTEGDVVRPEPGVYLFYVGSRVVEAKVAPMNATDLFRVKIGRHATDVRVIDRKHRQPGGESGSEGRETLVAPMPGKVVAVLAAAGDPVERGQAVLVVEAMKMQNEVRAGRAGVVAEIRVAVGDTVNAGQTLAAID